MRHPPRGRLRKSAATLTVENATMESSASDFESLVARVERLETEYHWLNSEVVTERLVLVDAGGKTRATLRMSEGVPGLILYDTEGKVCAILRVSAEGP